MGDTQVLRSVQSFMQASRMLVQSRKQDGVYIVLDDDESIAKLVSTLIQKRGHEARIAGSVMAGKLAIEELGADKVACVVVDYQLPNGTGVDFVTWLMNKFPQVPYFFYTANPEKVNAKLPPTLYEVVIVQKAGSLKPLLEALGV